MSRWRTVGLAIGHRGVIARRGSASGCWRGGIGPAGPPGGNLQSPGIFRDLQRALIDQLEKGGRFLSLVGCHGRSATLVRYSNGGILPRQRGLCNLNTVSLFGNGDNKASGFDASIPSIWGGPQGAACPGGRGAV